MLLVDTALLPCRTGCVKIVKEIIQSCVICRLNQNKYKRTTKGKNREFEIGSVWVPDIAYLPRSKGGVKYLLVFTERVSSYMTGIALKNITSATVSQDFKIFLSIMTQWIFYPVTLEQNIPNHSLKFATIMV